MLRGRPSFLVQEHRYLIGAHEVPGLGEIMKAGGELDDRWFNLSGRNRGGGVHELTHLLDLGLVKLEDIESDLRGWVIAYAAFVRQHRPRYDLVEEPVFNRGLGFATVIDRAGALPDEGPMVLNIKTGGRIDWHGVQRAGEVLAWRGALAPDVARFTLYIRKTGTFDLWRHPTPRMDHDTFLRCLHEWRQLCHDPRRHGPLSCLRDIRIPHRLTLSSRPVPRRRRSPQTSKSGKRE